MICGENEKLIAFFCDAVGVENMFNGFKDKIIS